MDHAPFRLVDVADLEPEWLVPPSSELLKATGARLGIPQESLHHAVVVVLPQCGLTNAYMHWITTVPNQGVGVMLMHPGAFVDAFGDGAIKRSIEHLTRTGQPSTAYVHRVFGKSPGSGQTGQGRQ